jgi:hypothetical protein
MRITYSRDRLRNEFPAAWASALPSGGSRSSPWPPSATSLKMRASDFSGLAIDWRVSQREKLVVRGQTLPRDAWTFGGIVGLM